MSLGAAIAPQHAPQRALRRAPVPAPPRHLRVVDPDARRRDRRARLVMRASVAAVVVTVLVVVGFHVVMAEGQLRLERLARDAAKEQLRYERLRLEYAQRAAPEAIVARATKIGMVPAVTQRYVTAPGLSAETTQGDGPTATPSTVAQDWEKVKRHLVAQP